MLQANDSPAKEIVCPRYELVYEYLRITGRPLTGLEQRAFLHMLDLDANERYVHSEIDGECVCMDLLPAIVQALDPDPVESVVAERTLEGQSLPARRWHTEKVGQFQGIVLGLKTQREHTSDLRKLARKELNDLNVVLDELLRRPSPEYASSEAMIEGEFPKLLELAKMTQRRKREPNGASGLTWAHATERIEAIHASATAQLQTLRRTLKGWGIPTSVNFVR